MTSSHLLSFRKLINLILFFVQRYVTAFHCFPRGIKEKKRLKSNDFQIIALCFIYFFSCCSRIFFEESESYCWPRGTSAHGRDKIVPGWSAVVRVEYSWSELRRLCQRTYSLGHMDWTVRGQTHYVTATYTSDWFWAPLGGTAHSLSSLLFFFLSIPSWTQQTYHDGPSSLKNWLSSIVLIWNLGNRKHFYLVTY